MTDASVRPFEPARDAPAVLDLLRRVLGPGPIGERSGAFLQWKHLDNPFGASTLYVAVIDEQLVGARALLRWRFRVGARTVSAARPVDTVTDPAFQRRGIFTALTNAGIAALDPDTAFLFNTPNDNSLPAYLKLGWKPVADVPIAVRPLRPVRFLRRARRAAEATPDGARPTQRPFDAASDVLSNERAAIEVLLATDDGDGRLRTDRSATYLDWRYADVPGIDYRAVTRWRGDELLGLAIGRVRRRGGLDEFTLTEVIVRPGDAATARRLLRSVARAGTDHVATHLSPSSGLVAAGRTSGYLRVPGRGMTLVANPLTEVTPDPRDFASWRLSLGDLELF